MEEKTDIRLRVKQIMNDLNLNQTKFAKEIGVRQNNLSEILSGKRPIGGAMLFKICSHFGISKEWIEEGRGGMYQTKLDAQFQPNAKILENTGFMNVPLVHVRAQCGYLSGYGDNEYMSQLPTMPVIVDKAYHGKYMLFEAEGDSMDDNTRSSICDRDIVLGREIQRHLWQYKLHISDWYFIIVHRTKGISIKKITDHNVETGIITCHSLNELYKDYQVSLNDVVELYNVIKIVDRSARL